MNRMIFVTIVGSALLSSSLACKKEGATPSAASADAGAGAAQVAPPSGGGGVIKIDGSSTVFPLSEAVAEEFQKANKGARVTVAASGTGGGFKKFCAGEIAVAGASRPIKSEELAKCKAAGIEFVELPLAYDGIAVIVSKQNTWVDHFTVAELKKIWEPEAQGKVTKWSQVREGWPDADLRLFGAGVDSGTYDYFTYAIVGKEHSSRGDYTSSEDDNVLVQGVAGDKNGLGFFGYAYYSENAAKLKLVPVDDGKPDNGAGPISPSLETVANGTYQPLSRPIFVYVSRKDLDRPEVKEFVSFYGKNAATLSKEVGYIPLSDAAYGLVTKRADAMTTGSIMHGGSELGATVEKMLGAQ